MTTETTPCVWAYTNEVDAWETSCGNMFEFTADGPAENRMKFCCYCGKHLQQEKGKVAA